MAQPLDVRRWLTTGRQLTEAGRSQAVALGTDLVDQGRLATDQVSAIIEEMVNRGGRERIEQLRQSVRGEVQLQLRTLQVRDPRAVRDPTSVRGGPDRSRDRRTAGDGT